MAFLDLNYHDFFSLVHFDFKKSLENYLITLKSVFFNINSSVNIKATNAGISH